MKNTKYLLIIYIHIMVEEITLLKYVYTCLKKRYMGVKCHHTSKYIIG